MADSARPSAFQVLAGDGHIGVNIVTGLEGVDMVPNTAGTTG
ncbi:hypothetical protein [Streptomyces sp. V4I2]|nr:hypothetical protein [Streptomyces sp. V4I2]MDQ1041918.1 hypothetical protein [Streptomyces sp. V4I2]